MNKNIALVPLILLGFIPPAIANVVAATLILEAGGQRDPRAMVAVFEVIRNRASNAGTSLENVCLKPKQFSCWNNVSRREEFLALAARHPKYTLALAIVNSNEQTNLTNGATHYHAKSVSPYWAKHMTKTITIEDHIFFVHDRK